ncbi:RelE family toxin-antitoxin system [Klebsiella pneumoniae]|nr:RelE family toxin-antitoxin system [Klebsiella pneumoniae]
MTTDITELTSVQKNANIHRLSRLLAYAPNDELRQLAVEVEQYTEQLIEALEHYKSREERVISLVRDNSKSWDELYRQVEAKGKRNVELVEALEKAQQQTTESENRVRKQNRHICELFDDNTALRQRIAELESRTVKLPDLRQIVSGDRYVWSDGVYNYSQDVKVVLAAAGIKMEVE